MPGTGFLGEFTHAAGEDARLDQLEISMAAVLMSEACNLGCKPVADPDEPALTRARLSHVDQNYLRADTIKAANARLINAQADLELARLWGGGLVASVDGLRFVVPVATIYAGHNPKYFGRRRGATWINAMNDQRAGIGAQVVPGTARDSLYTLDVMLNPDHGRRPEMVTSDTAGYSDLVFGLYRICGMQYAPRLADLTDTRFWRTTAVADYGCLSDLARHRVRLECIRAHWPQMLRIAGSLVTGTVRAYDLIRALGRSGNPTPLGQAFAEYGRIAKTQHLLAVCDPDDDSYRRGINAQQNQTESRHRLARKLFFGQRGELRQRYQEGMEAEFATIELGRGRLAATGVAVGADPVPYRLDYQLTTAEGYVTTRLVVRAAGEGWGRALELRREVDGSWQVEVDTHGQPDLPAPGGDVRGLQDALDCDLGGCPLTNTMPVLRHGLLAGGGPVELVMPWVSVPDLGVEPLAQRYTHLRRDATGSVVRFESEGFRADIVFDTDGLVVDYPGIAHRAWPSVAAADP